VICSTQQKKIVIAKPFIIVQVKLPPKAPNDDPSPTASYGLASYLQKIKSVIRTHAERFKGVIYYNFHTGGRVSTDEICNMLRRVLKHEDMPIRFQLLWAGILREDGEYRYFHSSNNTAFLSDTFTGTKSLPKIRAKLAGIDLVEQLSDEHPDSKAQFHLLTNIVVKVYRKK